MTPSSDLLLAHFRHYVLIALSGCSEDQEVQNARVYAVPQLPAALVAEFDLRDAPSQILGFLPDPACQDETACQTLAEALQGLQMLEPLSDTPACERVLDRLLRALDGEEEGMLRCTNPSQTEPAAGVADELDGRTLFTHLAQEILKGQVLPPAASRTADAYEVLAYTADDLSTLILRRFDYGRSFAFAACSSHDGSESPHFTRAIQELLAARLSDQPSPSTHPLLKTLSPEEADRRLTALAEVDHLQGAAYTQGLLLGSPSEHTRERLRAVQKEVVEASAQPTSPSAGELNLFACALASLKELDGAPLWTEELEHSGQSRIEILTHRAFPQALLAVAHLPADEHLSGGWALFVPEADPLVMAQLRADLTRMVSERGLFDTLSRPLSKTSPFIPVPPELTHWRLTQAVTALAHRQGHVEEHMAETAPTARPSAAWLLMQAMESSQRVH